MESHELGSYKIGERHFRDVASELARLRVQADVAWPQELRVLEWHGLRDDSRVLEPGCGPGFITLRLLEYLRNGSLTAVDIDATMLAHARELVRDSERVRFVEASAIATGLPADSFDVIVARYLLQHVPDAGAALAEFRRVLRPGGRLIVVDADRAFALLFDPEPSFYPELMAAVDEAQRRQGGDSTIGRRLPRLLVDAGFSDVAVDAVVAHSVVAGRKAIREIVPVQALDHMEAIGLVSSELAAAAREFFARVDSGDEPFEGMLSYLVVSGTA